MIKKTKIYYRAWCKCCQNFEIFNENSDSEFRCKNCKCLYDSSVLGEVPKDKIIDKEKDLIINF